MSNAHEKKIAELREKKKNESNKPLNEKREMVINGAILKCPYTPAPGKMVVTSNQLKLQDKLWATEGDKENMANLQFPGVCGHPKFSGQTPPPCMGVINLIGAWQNVGTNYIQEQRNLVKESYIMCDPLPNVRVGISVENILDKEIHKEEKKAKEKILSIYLSNE